MGVVSTRTPLVVWAISVALFAAAMVALAVTAPHLPYDRLPDLLLLMLLATASERVQIPLFRSSSVSVAFAVTFAAMIYLGPAAATWINLCVGLVLCVTPHRKPLVRMLFNIGNQVVAAFLAGQLLSLTLGLPPRDVDASLLPPTLLATLVYFAFNTVLLAAVISRTTNTSFTAVWQANYAWLAPSCAALGLAGTLMGVLIEAVGLIGLAIFTIPLAMAWYSFKLYMSKTEEVRSRNEELQVTNAQLDVTNARLNQRVTELEVLNQIGLSLNGSLDLSKVLGGILTSSLQLMPSAQAAAVVLADPSGTQLQVASSIGLPTPAADAALQAPDGPIVQAFATGEQRVIVDTAAVGLTTLAEYGARGFVAVPLRFRDAVRGVFCVTFPEAHEVSEEESVLLSTLAEQAATAVHNALLYRQIEQGYLHTIQAMVTVVDARERHAPGHSERVRTYALAAAGALGLDARQTATLELAALFHDVGHIGVPETVLNKPGELTPAEWEQVRKHPLLGVAILQQVPRMEAVVPVILQHHERYDGQGYPEGRLGNDTTLLAQVLAVADAFEAMTSSRPHRPAFTREEALAELRRQSGTQFAPHVVDAFLRAMAAETAERAAIAPAKPALSAGFFAAGN